jgi:putative nucleotidyltransferase with HDIG domain
MNAGRRPPALLMKTLAVTFGVMALVLVIVFAVVFATVRTQVYRAVEGNLASTQAIVAAAEARRQRDLRAQAAALAESSTLKAALDTYIAETRGSEVGADEQLLTTIARELEKISTAVGSDAVVAVDLHQHALAAAGPFADRWPRGSVASRAPPAIASGDYDGVAYVGGHAFRIITVPVQLRDEQIGALYLATSLDTRFAKNLEELSRSKIAIVGDRGLLATSLPPAEAAAFEDSDGPAQEKGTVTLNGELFAYHRLARVEDTSFYALSSIDESTGPAIRETAVNLTLIGLGAGVLAFVGSFSLARSLSTPIGHLSAALAHMASTHHVEGRLLPSGSSRELDTLTETFNELMSSVADAEAQTEAAYTGAIRALAAALDARDPYTAGHSERVSVVSIAIGRELGLSQPALEVLRLGALLHDIGKIGVSDEVLRKPTVLTASEYDAIKQHPVLGARILRQVPFLAPHLAIVELHHERPDGRGYPYGLRGDDIPLAARIVHVADAYDAMTSARAYRSARPAGEALRELWRCAGTEFHADIVGALATALPALTSEAAATARPASSEKALETVDG